jgi:epoxyqueuosine reductase
MMNAKELLIRCAKKTGFELVGICGPEKLSRTEAELTRQQEQGYQTPFTTANIASRVNPNLVFPGVQAIISLGLSYVANTASTRGTPLKPDLKHRMARFAWGRDYHSIVREMQNLLMAEWQQALGHPVNWVAYVDTGPLAEREIAWRAGLGWYGKNCNLLNRKLGSWFVLGEVLTDFYLEPDQPLENGCGNCDYCLQVCPAGALEQPYRLNAYHCVSYLTQAPGFIPQHLRKAMGNQIYGCDLCQQVCPHNIQSGDNLSREFGSFQSETDLEKLLALSNQEFRSTLGQTTAGWRGKKQLQRNAIIALGNSGSQLAVPALIKALADLRPDIRGYAAWALGQIGGLQAKQALEMVLAKEPQQKVQAELTMALLNIEQQFK